MPFDHVDIYAPFPKQTIEIQMAYVRERDGEIYAFQPRGPERGGLAGAWYGPIPDAGFKVVTDGAISIGSGKIDKATIGGLIDGQG